MKVLGKILAFVLCIGLVAFGIWCMFYHYKAIENVNFISSIPILFKVHMILLIPTIVVSLIIKYILRCEIGMSSGMFSVVPYLITLVILSFREAYFVEHAGIIFSIILSLLNILVEGLIPFIALFFMFPGDEVSSSSNYYSSYNYGNYGNREEKKEEKKESSIWDELTNVKQDREVSYSQRAYNGDTLFYNKSGQLVGRARKGNIDGQIIYEDENGRIKGDSIEATSRNYRIYHKND